MKWPSRYFKIKTAWKGLRINGRYPSIQQFVPVVYIRIERKFPHGEKRKKNVYLLK
jgi:hypothetical protein